jgi:FtsP/CotA-like multicopper oxidase with cupredoxin domain
MYIRMFLSLLTWLLCHVQLSLAAPTLVKRGGYGSKLINFEIDLTWEDSYQVGAPKKTILMNGQTPGPVLQMTVGDTVEFLVHNNLPFNTSVHFHGITQLNTPWNDGVPGLSQWSIRPGQSYMYKWTANEFGTFFYHAHQSGQIADGLNGAIIINPPADLDGPFSLISQSDDDINAMKTAVLNPYPVFVSDWLRINYPEFFEIEKAAGIDNYCPDAVIINGKVLELHFVLGNN